MTGAVGSLRPAVAVVVGKGDHRAVPCVGYLDGLAVVIESAGVNSCDFTGQARISGFKGRLVLDHQDIILRAQRGHRTAGKIECNPIDDGNA